MWDSDEGHRVEQSCPVGEGRVQCCENRSSLMGASGASLFWEQKGQLMWKLRSCHNKSNTRSSLNANIWRPEVQIKPSAVMVSPRTVSQSSSSPQLPVACWQSLAFRHILGSEPSSSCAFSPGAYVKIYFSSWESF